MTASLPRILARIYASYPQLFLGVLIARLNGRTYLYCLAGTRPLVRWHGMCLWETFASEWACLSIDIATHSISKQRNPAAHIRRKRLQSMQSPFRRLFRHNLPVLEFNLRPLNAQICVP